MFVEVFSMMDGFDKKDTKVMEEVYICARKNIVVYSVHNIVLVEGKFCIICNIVIYVVSRKIV